MVTLGILCLLFGVSAINAHVVKSFLPEYNEDGLLRSDLKDLPPDQESEVLISLPELNSAIQLSTGSEDQYKLSDFLYTMPAFESRFSLNSIRPVNMPLDFLMYKDTTLPRVPDTSTHIKLEDIVNAPKSMVLYTSASKHPTFLIPESSGSNVQFVEKLPFLNLDVNRLISVPEMPVNLIIEESSKSQEPIIEEIKSIEIPQAPELPAFTMPELPIPVGTSDNLPEIIHTEPVSFQEVQKLPYFVIPEMTNIKEIKKIQPCSNDEHRPQLEEIKKVEIPPAPELPAFLTPASTFNVQETIEIAPQHPTFLIPESSGSSVQLMEKLPCSHSDENKPISVLSPPELPPLSLPEMPVNLVIEESSNTHEPIIEEIKTIEIPQAPELPAFTMPELPIPVGTSENLPEITHAEPVGFQKVQNLPYFVIPEMTYIEEINNVQPCSNEEHRLQIEEIKKVDIPPVPELPAFLTPASIFNVKEPIEIAQPHLTEDHKFENIIIEDFKPLEIPQPPELPALTLPVIHVENSEPYPTEELKPEEPRVEDIKIVEIPQAPMLPIMVMTNIPMNKVEEEAYGIVEQSSAHNIQPIVDDIKVEIPQAPQLPSFTLSYKPIHKEEHTFEHISSSLTEESPDVLIIEDVKPIDIPSPPELPPLTMPTMPVAQEVAETIEPCLIEELKPNDFIEAPVLPPLDINIPKAPELPLFTLPAFNEHFENHHIEISQPEHASLLPQTFTQISGTLPDQEVVEFVPCPDIEKSELFPQLQSTPWFYPNVDLRGRASDNMLNSMLPTFIPERPTIFLRYPY